MPRSLTSCLYYAARRSATGRPPAARHRRVGHRIRMCRRTAGPASEHPIFRCRLPRTS